MKKRIAITGGLGSGGSFLAEYVLNNHPEYEVWIPCRWHSDSSFKNIREIRDKVTLRECDLNDLPSILRFLQECQPVKIFNMAATANVAVSFKTPISVMQNNIFSSLNLLEAVRMVCPETIFQHCSTSEVCGTPLTMPITEDHPLNPSNVYAISKLTTEKLAMFYYEAFKLKIIISRAFCYANPKRHDLFGTAFSLQIARIEAGKQEVLKHGNLNSIRTMMSVIDMSEAYWILSELEEFGDPFNLGGNVPISVGDFLDKLILRAKCPIKKEQCIELMRPSDITNQCPDTSKFFKATGWKPKYSLDDCADFLMEEARKVVKNES